MTCVLTFWNVNFFFCEKTIFFGEREGVQFGWLLVLHRANAKGASRKARKEVEDAKAKVVATEMTLFSEVSASQNGEQRHAAFQSKRQGRQSSQHHNARGFRSRIWLRSPSANGKSCGSSWGSEVLPHQPRRVQVNSVIVNTSIRSDVATSSIGHQRWQSERSEPVGIDGDFDRRRISRHPIDGVRCNRGERVCCVLLAKGQVTAWVARRASGRTCQNSHHLRCRVLRCIAVRRGFW